MQQEAEAFTQRWGEKLQYHVNTSVQIQSVFSAERQQHQQDLKEQTEHWQLSLSIVFEGAQEELVERKSTIEELTKYLQETAKELEQYEEGYDSHEQQETFC